MAYRVACNQSFRKLEATTDLPPGRCVLQESPYACVLNSDSQLERCDCCFALSTNQPLSRCSGCKSVYYADKTHQKAAWKAGHKEECPILAAAAAKGPLPPATVRLALRILLRAYRDQELHYLSSQTYSIEISTADPLPNGFQGVLSLLSHWDDTSDSTKIEFAHLGAWAWSLLQETNSELCNLVTPKDITLIISRISCNSHTICDDEMRPIGLGLYPTTAMANHSCTPNCAQTFGKDGNIELRTIRSVSKGEELTIAYVELAAPRWERRSELLRSHYFDIDSDNSYPKSTIMSKNEYKFEDIYPFVHQHHQIDTGNPLPWRHDSPRDLALTSIVVVNSISSTGSEVSKTSGSKSLLRASFGVWGEIRPPSPSIEREASANGSDNEEKLDKSPIIEFHSWSTSNEIDNVPDIAFMEAYGRALHALHEMNHSAPRTAAEHLKRIYEQLTDPLCRLKFLLGPRHVLRLQLLAARLKYLIDGGEEWSEALAVGRELLPLYKFSYSFCEVWPPLVLHIATLAKLEHYVGEPKMAALYARQALMGLEVVGGPGRPVCREMERIWREVAAETGMSL